MKHIWNALFTLILSTQDIKHPSRFFFYRRIYGLFGGIEEIYHIRFGTAVFTVDLSARHVIKPFNRYFMEDRKSMIESCEKAKPEVEYTLLQELIDNLPYIFMTILGALVFIVGSQSHSVKWLLAGSYIFYGVAGALWIVIFVCPYCHYYGTRTCPCGYGRISARLRKVKDQSLFSKKFKKHIPIIVPLWIIPVVTGTVFLADNFSYLLMTLVVLFAVDAFFVLPLISRKYGCAHCPQKETCPWMSS